MKHILLITTLLLFSITTINSQEATEKNKNYTFGLSFGFDHVFSTVENFNIEDTSFYTGIFFEKSLSEKFNLKVETIFSTVKEYELFSVELPIIVSYKLNDKVSLFSGLQVDYLFDNERNSSRIKNNFGIGVNFGLQYNISKKWFLDTRYINSLSEQIVLEKSKRKSLRFGIGYRF